MLLKNLINDIDYVLVNGSLNIDISGISYSSKESKKGNIFICIKGFSFDGHNYINDAIKNGSVAIVISSNFNIEELNISKDITIISIKDTRYALAKISAKFFDYPSTKLDVIGVTGTKGKTSTTYIIKNILEKAGYKVGLIGSIEIIDGKNIIKSKNTTPESYEIQKHFYNMVHNGIKIAIIEVSSQALMLNRVAGINFKFGIFTNISKDHISKNEHKNFDDYLYYKSLLFKKCEIGIGNIDDKNFEKIFKNSTCKIKTFSLNNKKANIYINNKKLVNKDCKLGISFSVCGEINFSTYINMPGIFNIYNSISSILVCLNYIKNTDYINEVLNNIKIKGRLENINISKKFLFFIDYAHNAMALESLLKGIREYNPKRIVCIFGCGGNRDKMRRFEMGIVSGNFADFTIITSDNPRFEEPIVIINQIEEGIKTTKGKYIKIIDRKEAIKFAINNGKEGDIVILAGKGHEDYQEIKGIKYKLDERDVIKDILSEIHNSNN